MAAASSSDRPVAIVTGGTSGIGRATAIELARRGYRTVIVGRGAERASAVAAEMARKVPGAVVESVPVEDLAERSQVRTLAQRLAATYPSIRILINNAGAYHAQRQATSDGLERTFALNVLAPFILTSSLLGPLRAGGPSRVVEVASAAHLGHHVPFDDLQAERHYSGFEVYGRSKLELILLTRAFARRLAGSDVVVNSVHPGFIRSGFGENNPGGVGFGVKVAKFLFARSIAYGMRNEVFVADDPSAGTVSGEYFARERVTRTSREGSDLAAAERLFAICQQLAGTPELPPPAPAVSPPTTGRPAGTATPG